MNILQSKTLNLTQLLYHAKDNNITNEEFKSHNGVTVFFDENGRVYFEQTLDPNDDLFDVAYEIEITKYTKLKELIVSYQFNDQSKYHGKGFICQYGNVSIDDIIERNKYHNNVKDICAMYILNDSGLLKQVY